eukprot:scaffold58401_cov66-Phaeocystis_antarctica.AAC.5
MRRSPSCPYTRAARAAGRVAAARAVGCGEAGVGLVELALEIVRLVLRGALVAAEAARVDGEQARGGGGGGALLEGALETEAGGVARVTADALEAAREERLVVGERLEQHARDDELGADEEADLLLHAAVAQHAAADGAVGEVELQHA